MIRFRLAVRLSGLLLVVAGLAAASARAWRARAPVVALVDGTVVAIDGGPALQNAVVLIEGDRISKVGAARHGRTCPPTRKSFP